MTLTDDDNGSTHEVQLGETIEVRLAENPATGYLWSAEVTNPALLRLVRDVMSGAGAAPGAGGAHLFEFHALLPGTVTLRFSCCRPWEVRGAITRYFQVQLRVMENEQRDQ